MSVSTLTGCSDSLELCANEVASGVSLAFPIFVALTSQVKEPMSRLLVIRGKDMQTFV